VAVKFAPSRGEARRLIEQGGVKVNYDRISDPAAECKFNEGDILRVGKRKFGKILF
jgi:tyrosyl-tRNA synthetase